MYENAAEVEAIVLFALKKLDDRKHGRVLAVVVRMNSSPMGILNSNVRTRWDCERQTNSAHEPITTIVDDGNSSWRVSAYTRT